MFAAIPVPMRMSIVSIVCLLGGLLLTRLVRRSRQRKDS